MRKINRLVNYSYNQGANDACHVIIGLIMHEAYKEKDVLIKERLINIAKRIAEYPRPPREDFPYADMQPLMEEALSEPVLVKGEEDEI